MASSEAVAERRHLQHRRFVFGEYEMDLERGSLKRCGEDIPLRPKSFAMLRYLLERAGQLVAREELLAVVWPGVVVTDDSVAQCLIEIRKALGDDERAIIRTVPRRGLIFDVPVRVEDTATPPAPWPPPRAARYGWMLAVALAGVAALLLWWLYPRGPAATPDSATASTSPAHAIAVLRFTDMSPAGDQSYLADGLSEEIMHMLAQSPSLRVIARASSFAVEGQSIAAIAEQLDVSHVLEGSVRRQGDEVRVTAQLVDGATSAHIWSRTYDRNLDDILHVQSEIAGAVAGTLEVSFTDIDAMTGIDPRAYELFLEGRYFYLRRADGDLGRAQDRFEEAISINPEFARAWTGVSAVANALLRGPEAPDLSPDEREQVLKIHRHAAEQALRFGPNLPEAHIRAATYYYFNGEWNRARKHFEIARSIDPDHWLVRAAQGNELRASGRIEESIPLIRRNMQRDPLNLVLRENLVGNLVWAGRFDDAQAELDKTFALVPSTMDLPSPFRFHVPRVQILTGDYDVAVTTAESLADSVERSHLLALAYHGLGRRSDSEAALEQIASALATPWRALYAAEVLAFRGENAKAAEWLKGIEVTTHCTDWLFFTESVYYSPFLAKLNGTPAWEDYRAGVLERMKGCLLGLEVDPA